MLSIIFIIVIIQIQIQITSSEIKSRTYKIISNILDNNHELHKFSNCIPSCNNKNLLYISLKSHIDNNNIINLLKHNGLKVTLWLLETNIASCDELLSSYKLNSFDHI